MNEPLEKVVMDMLVELKLLEQVMTGINDYGDWTGFCQQDSSIRDRLRRYCSDVQCDSRTMRRRIEKWKESQQSEQEVEHE
jgi:hypothetical protein